MKPTPAGSGLLLLVMLSSLLWSKGRELLCEEELPAFFLARSAPNLLLFEGEFSSQGLHQYSDGDRLDSVIKMAIPPGAVYHSVGEIEDGRPLPGLTVTACINADKTLAVSLGWMPARQRMALGIPLHPDRMGLSDWQALPGIGPKLAFAIEKNRQENGEFGSLEALERVRGVGPKRIEAWRRYF